MAGTRKQRLQETIRAELSDIIRREMRDPRFSEGLLSITDVDVSQDLKHATVFVSVYGDDQARKDELNALRGATGVLRGELGRRRVLKSIPELSFRYDESLERGSRMFEVLEQIKRDDAARGHVPFADEAAATTDAELEGVDEEESADGPEEEDGMSDGKLDADPTSEGVDSSALDAPVDPTHHEGDQPG